jgi:hypothetical protein
MKFKNNYFIFLVVTCLIFFGGLYTPYKMHSSWQAILHDPGGPGTCASSVSNQAGRLCYMYIHIV